MNLHTIIVSALVLFLIINTHTATDNNLSDDSSCSSWMKDLIDDPDFGDFFSTYAEEKRSKTQLSLVGSHAGPAEREDTPSPPLAKIKDKNPKAQKNKKSSYQCTLCTGANASKDWKSKFKLERHLTTHTKQKSFECSLCNSKLSQQNAVINHLQAKSHRSTTEEALRKQLGLKKGVDVSKYILDRKILATFVIKNE